uniref:Uncharacterized protein n=1 Tax=Pelusios castaneus TaxID=367368 RepID=A0A8C8RS46_9SAUR
MPILPSSLTPVSATPCILGHPSAGALSSIMVPIRLDALSYLLNSALLGAYSALDSLLGPPPKVGHSPQKEEKTNKARCPPRSAVTLSALPQRMSTEPELWVVERPSPWTGRVPVFGSPIKPPVQCWPCQPTGLIVQSPALGWEQFQQRVGFTLHP